MLFFFTDTATTEIYTLSLHDALPIFEEREQVPRGRLRAQGFPVHALVKAETQQGPLGDRKSTRLNSSHVEISYAVFCLKKKTAYRENLQTNRYHAPLNA